ncbi:ATP-binding protein [Sphingomonas profundi]|uniref:ATP-binding protein n=1 Tax=Alterirhizorhabdus profundi TaxID=2681549 RepID=UPI0024110CC8|nr:ATP-binding protein [Sphingomonas profundi]
MKLIAGDWIATHDNLVITGPTGVGNSWLACALGHKACRDDCSVLYQRVPRLFANLALARGEGRHARLLRTLGSVQLMILHDWSWSRWTLWRATICSGSRKAIWWALDPRHQPASRDRLA